MGGRRKKYRQKRMGVTKMCQGLLWNELSGSRSCQDHFCFLEVYNVVWTIILYVEDPIQGKENLNLVSVYKNQGKFDVLF